MTGGLTATYYDDTSLIAPRSSKQWEGAVDFSGACGPGDSFRSDLSECAPPPASSLSNGESFSVRWTGL
eukprot:3880656-Rhodomonas_salina.1